MVANDIVPMQIRLLFTQIQTQHFNLWIKNIVLVNLETRQAIRKLLLTGWEHTQLGDSWKLVSVMKCYECSSWEVRILIISVEPTDSDALSSSTACSADIFTFYVLHLNQ